MARGCVIYLLHSLLLYDRACNPKKTIEESSESSKSTVSDFLAVRSETFLRFLSGIPGGTHITVYSVVIHTKVGMMYFSIITTYSHTIYGGFLFCDTIVRAGVFLFYFLKLPVVRRQKEKKRKNYMYVRIQYGYC